MENFTEFLVISALIFFNAFCILGCIISVMLMTVVGRFKRKTFDTLDTAQGAMFAIYDSVEKSKGGLLPAVIKLARGFMK